MATKTSRKVYATKAWRYVRREVIRRAGYRCSECGGRHNLEVHHKVRLADGGDPFDDTNLVCVCRDCHLDKHRAGKVGRPGMSRTLLNLR